MDVSLDPIKDWNILSQSDCRDIAKGQLISKCLFGVFTFFQKTNGNKSTSSLLGRNVGLYKSFRVCLTFRKKVGCTLPIAEILSGKNAPEK